MTQSWDRTNKMKLCCTKVNSFLHKILQITNAVGLFFSTRFSRAAQSTQGGDALKKCFAFGPYRKIPIDVSHGLPEDTRDGSSPTCILVFLDKPVRVV